MRTNIEIDDKLMNDTLRATGLKTKREAGSLGFAPCFCSASRNASASCVAS